MSSKRQNGRVSLWHLAMLPIVVVSACFVIDVWMAHKAYLFTAKEVAEIANIARSRGGSAEEMMSNVTQLFMDRYPGAIHDTEWIFMRAGGWMGSFKMLYSSVTEYVLLFGTAMDTSGHSGRYWAHIEDTILTGRFTQWQEGKVTPLVHGPGVTVVHQRFEATGVQWDGGTWMVEHAQGFIPSALPFAFGDSITSSQDFYSIWRSIVVYTKLIVGNLLAGRI